MSDRVKSIEYMCTVCGTRKIVSTMAGRPLPGKCPRHPNNGPHRWVINKKYY